jgi:hypothetical protein
MAPVCPSAGGGQKCRADVISAPTRVRDRGCVGSRQSLGNRALTPSPECPPPLTDDADIGPIRCQRFLGGLLRHYYRDAA